MIKKVKSFKVYCDRCGKVLCGDGAFTSKQDIGAAIETSGLTTIHIDAPYIYNPIHLCPECADNVIESLEDSLGRKEINNG